MTLRFPVALWQDFAGTFTASVLDGASLAAYDSTDRSRIPMFVKEGAVVPLEVGDDSTGLGGLSSAGQHRPAGCPRAA